MIANQPRFLSRTAARFGDIFTVRVPYLDPLVVISRPDLIKQVFQGDPKVFHAGEGNVVLKPILGARSVLVVDEGEHLWRRKLLLPPFHGERMRLYGEIMREATDHAIDKWPIGSTIPSRPEMQAITLEVICRAVFGIEESDKRDKLLPLMERQIRQAEAVMEPAWLTKLLGRRSRWHGFDKTQAEVHALLIGEIHERRAAGAGAGERNDILQLLVDTRDEDGNELSDEEITAQLLTLLVAGHETTASSLSWAFERLVSNPAVLDKLTESIRSDDREYVDAVIKETMRTRPVLEFAMRQVTQTVELGGYEIPSGTVIGSCSYLTHLRPDIYPDPHAFRPERFIEKPAETYSWIPFGGGVRRCLGAAFAEYEMRIVLETVLRRCELETTPGRRGERQRRRVITFAPARGGEIVVKRRAPGSKPQPAAASKTQLLAAS